MIDQEKANEFRSTELGRLFFLYDAKIQNAWIMDTLKTVNLGGVSENYLKQVWDETNATREALILKLMEMQNGTR